MTRTIMVLGAALLVTTLAGAQTKISGSLHCGKPDPQHVIEVGDRPGHSFSLSKGNCTWTKPMEIAGIQDKEYSYVATGEMRGNRSHGYGAGVDTMANGDKAYDRFHGSTTLKDGAPQTAEGKWSYTGGTGKLNGLRGKGTYKGKAEAEGSFTYEIEGEYELPK